jgi:hypothetical protein
VDRQDECDVNAGTKRTYVEEKGPVKVQDRPFRLLQRPVRSHLQHHRHEHHQAAEAAGYRALTSHPTEVRQTSVKCAITRWSACVYHRSVGDPEGRPVAVVEWTAEWITDVAGAWHVVGTASVTCETTPRSIRLGTTKRGLNGNLDCSTSPV